MAQSSKKSLLKRFLPYYKPYKKMFARDLGCATVVAAVELVFPLACPYADEHLRCVGNAYKSALYMADGTCDFAYACA